MKKILDEYRFVKLTRKITYQLEKDANVGVQSSGYLAAHPSTSLVKQRYLKRHWTSNPSKVQRICRNALKEKFLEPVGLKVGENQTIDGLCVTDKGDDLLDRALGLYPSGYGILGGVSMEVLSLAQAWEHSF